MIKIVDPMNDEKVYHINPCSISMIGREPFLDRFVVVIFFHMSSSQLTLDCTTATGADDLIASIKKKVGEYDGLTAEAGA